VLDVSRTPLATSYRAAFTHRRTPSAIAAKINQTFDEHPRVAVRGHASNQLAVGIDLVSIRIVEVSASELLLRGRDLHQRSLDR
jgi:hypothetical protein